MSSPALREVRPAQAPPRTVLRSIIVMIVAVALAAGIFTVFGPHQNQFDFRIYFSAIQYWLSGHDLYEYAQFDRVNGSLGYTYPPVAAIAMAPFHILGRTAAIDANFLVIIASGWITTWYWLRERLSHDRLRLITASVCVTAALFCLRPFGENIAFGQINLPLAALVSIDLLGLDRRRSKWTGVALGMAMAVKLTPAVFLLYLLLEQRWRALLTAMGTFLFLTAVSGAVMPVEFRQFWLHAVWDTTRVGPPANTSNLSTLGILARWAAPAGPATAWWGACCLALLVVTVGLTSRALSAGDRLGAVTLVGLFGLLVSPISWGHHAVWVEAALLIIALRFRSGSPVPGPVVFRWVRRLHTFSDAVRLLFFGLSLWLWFMDYDLTFRLPDLFPGSLSPGQVLETSLRTLWMIGALLVIGVERNGSSTAPFVVRAARTSPDDVGV